jgi:tetrahydromethanopterin S-methyltransferase subunit G
MPAGAGLRGAVKDVARRASAVARLQVELVKAELANTGKNAGVGIGLVIGAVFIGVFALALLTALFVVVLAIALPMWLSILIVLVVYLIVIAILGALARNRFRQAKGAPLAAEQARLTFDALGLSRSGDGAPPPSAPGSEPVAQPSDRGPDVD